MMVIKIKKYNKKKERKIFKTFAKKIYRKCLNGKIARSI